MSGVYDSENSQNPKQPKHSGSHDDTGDSKAHETTALGQMEAGLGDQAMRKHSRAEEKEADRLKKTDEMNSNDSGWKTNVDDNSQGFKVTGRRLAIAGGVSGLAVGGSVGFMTFLAGPLQFIHMSQMMQSFHLSDNEDAADNRSSRFLRSVLNKKPENGRLGAVATKYAQRWERRMSEKSGIRVAYNSNGRFVGYYADPNHPNAQRLIDDFRKDGVPIEDNPSIQIRAPDNEPLTGGLFINANDSNFRNRRSMIKTGVKSAGVNGLSSAIGYRALIGRAGVDMHPFNRVRRGADNLRDYSQKLRETRAEEDRTGVADPDSDRVFEGEDSDGDGTNDLSDDQGTANDAAQEAISDAKADPERGKISVEAKLAGGGAAAIGILCTVRAMSDDVGEYQNSNVVLPLTRIGSRFTSMGDQVAYGEGFSNDELAATHMDLNNPDSWMSAESIQRLLGRPGGVPIPDAAKPTPNKNGGLELVDNLFGAIGVAGDAMCHPVTSLVLSATDLLNPVTLAKMGLDYASSAAGVNPQELLVEWITEKLRGEDVDLANARGSELGNYIDTGNFLAANNQAISMGGRKLTDTEVAELDAYRNQIKEEENRDKSYFARMFDLGDIDSLASQTLVRNPGITRPQTTIANFIKEPLGVFKSVGNSFAALTTPRAYAQSTPHDYGVDKYRFSLGELQDERFEDPFENAAIVEPRLTELNDKYGKCYGTKVTDNKLTFEAQPRYDQLNSSVDGFDACDDNSLIAKRYRFYIIDTITEHTLSCYEGATSSCTMIGVNVQDTGGTTGTTIDPNLPQGSKEELIEKIKSSGKVQGADKLSTDMKQTILAVIAKLSEKYEFTISSTIRSGNPNSPHINGSAVDLGNINGNGVPTGQDYAASNQDSLDFARDAATLLPGASWLGVPNDAHKSIANPIMLAKGGSSDLDTPETTKASGAHFHLNCARDAP